ncbi:hypothetical protein E2542_SST01559 [Spatholobus suberectus]|nr:hypothetical protein E2542_SST01559 [Spatholobus suberectus]
MCCTEGRLHCFDTRQCVVSRQFTSLWISFLLVWSCVFAFPTVTHLKTIDFNTTASTHSQQAHFGFPVYLKRTNLKPSMGQSKSNDETTNSPLVKEERAKQESKAILHPQKCYHDRETHGLHSGIDENTSMDDVRAPNVFERAKEEFQALAEVFHHRKKTQLVMDENQMTESSKHKQEAPNSPSETKAKAASIFVRAKQEIKAIIHHDKSQHNHHIETHGRSDDINENTPASEVKGPNVYERVKEEFEAVLQAIHPKKES